MRDTLALYEGPGKPDLAISLGDPGVDPIDGRKAAAAFDGKFDRSYQGNWDKIAKDGSNILPETGALLTSATLKSAELVLDQNHGSNLTLSNRQLVADAAHEIGHADLAARDPLKYLVLGAKDKNFQKGKPIPHDKRPIEQLANTFMELVLRQIYR